MCLNFITLVNNRCVLNIITRFILETNLFIFYNKVFYTIIFLHLALCLVNELKKKKRKQFINDNNCLLI